MSAALARLEIPGNHDYQSYGESDRWSRENGFLFGSAGTTWFLFPWRLTFLMLGFGWNEHSLRMNSVALRSWCCGSRPQWQAFAKAMQAFADNWELAVKHWSVHRLQAVGNPFRACLCASWHLSVPGGGWAEPAEQVSGKPVLREQGRPWWGCRARTFFYGEGGQFLWSNCSRDALRKTPGSLHLNSHLLNRDTACPSHCCHMD